MSLNFEVVVGANWGDEGKGLVTAELTKKAFEKYPDKHVLNVLYSGGSQRGHTVDYTRVLRHVYRHLGAGTLHGADTYMNANFMVNPSRLMAELNDIGTFINQSKLQIYINDKCRVTTPYDIFINQALEKKRGKDNHGSCGLGIYECRKRYEDMPDMPRYSKIVDILDSQSNEELNKLLAKWQRYFGARVNELNISVTAEELTDLENETREMLSCLNDIRYFWAIGVSSLSDIVRPNEGIYSTVIYEGSQGIALSESNVEDFPHLTPANTTARNALAEISEYCIDNAVYDSRVAVDYVSRTYFTRHGADPKFNGTPNPLELNHYKIERDKTNKPNTYQGIFKYSPMDFDILIKHIKLSRKDCEICKKFLPNVNENIYFTHANEVNDFGGFMCSAIDKIPINNIYYSDSPYGDFKLWK